MGHADTAGIRTVRIKSAFNLIFRMTLLLSLRQPSDEFLLQCRNSSFDSTIFRSDTG